MARAWTTWGTVLAGLAIALSAASAHAADAGLLNASYDVARDVYRDLNPAFVAQYREQIATDPANDRHLALLSLVPGRAGHKLRAMSDAVAFLSAAAAGTVRVP